jgi:hypothetical protein
LQDEDARGRLDAVAQITAIDHRILLDEHVDVLAQSTALVADVERDPGRERVERTDDLGDGRGVDDVVLAREVGEEVVEVVRESLLRLRSANVAPSAGADKRGHPATLARGS